MLNSTIEQRDPRRRVALVIVALAPIIGVLLLRAPLINQNGYLDAWFYTGYGWAPQHHLTVFGSTYYGVRFPPVLLIAAASKLFGPVAGYLVLRYLILLAAGAALYTCVQRFASRRVAAAAVVLLALNPIYLRLVLWDYVTFVAIPASLAGVALWPRRVGKMGLAAGAGSGALLATAAFANPLAISILPPLLGVESVAALRRRAGEPLRFVLRVTAAVGGALAVYLAGWLIYGAIAGFASPYELLRPTLDFLSHQDERAAGYVLPVRKWIFGEPRIYAPLVLLLGMAIVLRSRLLGTDVVARLSQFSIVFVVEYFLYRFVTTSSVIETWWAYGMTAVPMAFAGAVVLNELDRVPDRRTWTIAGAVAATGLTALIIRLAGTHAVASYEHLRGHWWAVLLVVALGVVGLIAWRQQRASLAFGGVVALFVVVTALALAPANYFGVERTGEFSGRSRDELRGYDTSRSIVRYIADHDTPASRTLVWYPAATGLLGAIWSVLPHVGGSINAYDVVTPLTKLTEYEAGRLAYPTTASVLVLSEDREDLVRAQATLRRHGYDLRAERPGAWADGRLHHQILHLRQLPAGGTARAVRLSAAAVLSAWRRGDATAACRLSVPELVLSHAAQRGTCPTAVRPRLHTTPAPRLGVGAVSIQRDRARVTLADSTSTIVLHRVQSEWLAADGDVPWVR